MVHFTVDLAPRCLRTASALQIPSGAAPLLAEAAWRGADEGPGAQARVCRGAEGHAAQRCSSRSTQSGREQAQGWSWDVEASGQRQREWPAFEGAGVGRKALAGAN